VFKGILPLNNYFTTREFQGGFLLKDLQGWYTSLRFVESPDIFIETIKGMRGSPSVESPGKLCKVKAFEERLT
jgi:hypothetical protein